MASFFGLFGANGPLPLHLTEYAYGRQLQAGDPSFARFADIIHHRFLGLFHRAWAQAQLTRERELMVLGVYGGPGLSVAGEVMPRSAATNSSTRRR